MDGTLPDANGFPEADIGEVQTLLRELDKFFIWFPLTLVFIDTYG